MTDLITRALFATLTANKGRNVADGLFAVAEAIEGLTSAIEHQCLDVEVQNVVDAIRDGTDYIGRCME
jgi:hypothetical protein